MAGTAYAVGPVAVRFVPARTVSQIMSYRLQPILFVILVVGVLRYLDGVFSGNQELNAFIIAVNGTV